MKGTPVLGQHLSVHSSSVQFLLVLCFIIQTMDSIQSIIFGQEFKNNKPNCHIKHHSIVKGTKLKIIV